MKKNLWQKRIPTIAGLAVLVIGLVAGVVMLTLNGGPVFITPRAAPETTPQKIKLTNVTDTSFTVSFMTPSKTAGFVKWGTESGTLNSQASDDRDQLTGTAGEFTTHHITVRGLQPNTEYFYVLGTGSRTTFDNNGAPFSVKTASRAGAPPAAKTAYGNVLTGAGAPAEGAIVYVTIDNVGELSSLVKNSGSYAIPLSTARTRDGAGYAQLTDESPMRVMAQGTELTQSAEVVTTVADSQPIENLTLGQGGAATTQNSLTGSTAQTATTRTSPSPSPSPSSATTTDEGENDATTSATSSRSENLNSLIGTNTSTATGSTTVDVDATTPPTVTTSQPTIKGKAAPSVVINIEVNSEHTITQQVTADASGNFVLDISKLSETLEPGEHTVTITYTDPDSGETVTKEQTFTVAQSSTVQLAQATTSPSPTPFGSGNPFPATSSASPSPSASPKVATSSTTASGSARTTMPSTSSGVPVSGTVSTTLALIIGGLFFMIAGGWSFWIAYQLEQTPTEE